MAPAPLSVALAVLTDAARRGPGFAADPNASGRTLPLALWLYVESAWPTHTAESSWQLASQWFSQHWPWLGLLVVVVAVVALLVRFWQDLLAWEGGSAWPVPAAILPPFIAIVRGWDPMGPWAPMGSIVIGALLAFIALLQFYGQARSEGYRKAADDAIRGIGVGVNRIGARVNRIGSGVKQQGAELDRIGAEVNRIGDGVKQQGTELGRISAGVGRLADYLTSEEEAGDEENV